MLKGFIGALRFLSIFPFGGRAAEEGLQRAAGFFPLAGLCIGGFLSLLDRLFLFLGFPALLSAALLVCALAFITGAMHLDGLADTADGIFSGKDKDGILTVMRDPHTGALGTTAVVCDLILKTALLASLNGHSREAALLFMCVLSRWSAVPAMALFPYARTEGKAKVFIASLRGRALYSASLQALLFSLLLRGAEGVLFYAGVFLLTILSGKFYLRKIGGITGDTLGAQIEISELLVLFALCILKTEVM